MTRFTRTMPSAYFENLYRSDRDPWGFEVSDYERSKYAATLCALPRSRYRHALEVGCSIAVFTQALAAVCDNLTAIDASETAITLARERCRTADNVDFACMAVPDSFPIDDYDLIVLSEVLYYLDHHDLDELASACSRSIVAGGDLVLVHWTGPTNYPLTGDEAAERFIASMKQATLGRQLRTRKYRLDVLKAPQ